MTHTPQQITELWAWICTEPDGGEGVPAFNSGGAWLPMMGADRERIESLRDMAELTARTAGYPLKLARFTTMEIVEVVRP